MSHEHKVALEKIISVCEKSRQPTKRIERVMDIALEALGLTANQREAEITAMRQAAIQKQRDRVERIVRNNYQEEAA
jgi:hypothetical protein